MAKLVEVKWCPFCGGLSRSRATGPKRWWVECDDCGGIGPIGRSLELAVNAWNRRSDTRRMTALEQRGQ